MGDITILLKRWRAGDRDAEGPLFEMIWPELRHIARHQMSNERRGHTLEPTELVNQVYGRMVASRDRDWQNRGHFFALAARAMGQYLIDHARARGGVDLVALEEAGGIEGTQTSGPELAAMLETPLKELAQSHSQWCTIVELKFFLGLSDKEIAEVLAIPLRTVQRSWHDARCWLFERLGGSPPAEEAS